MLCYSMTCGDYFQLIREVLKVSTSTVIVPNLRGKGLILNSMGTRGGLASKWAPLEETH